MQRRDPAAKPLHIQQVLYYWRVHAASTSGGTAAKPYVKGCAKGRGRPSGRHRAAGQGGTGQIPGHLPCGGDIPEPEPLVSILIPNKDHTDDLENACTASTPKRPTKISRSSSLRTIPLTRPQRPTTKTAGAVRPRRVVTYKGGFNFSRINNFGRKYAAGKYLLLLNNDVEVINGDWLTQMVGECSQPGVGLCGAMLYYPDDTIQHAGIITGWAATPGTATSTTSAAAAGICSGWPRCRIFPP